MGHFPASQSLARYERDASSPTGGLGVANRLTWAWRIASARVGSNGIALWFCGAPDDVCATGGRSRPGGGNPPARYVAPGAGIPPPPGGEAGGQGCPPEA